MRVVEIHRSFEAWRDAARVLLAEGAAPGDVLWREAGGAGMLFEAEAIRPSAVAARQPRVSAEFVELDRDVACHRDVARWALLYTVLWRIVHGERNLLKVEVDEDVRRLVLMQQQVGSDRHLMTGFVRFHVMKQDGEERYVAWYRPAHYVLRSATGSFVHRFSTMRWSIFTPDESAHWDGSRLTFTEGVPTPPNSEDELEGLWRTYYRAAFIPSRANPKALDRLLPRKYREAMPELEAIEELTRRPPARA